MKFSELHRRLERAGWYIVRETDRRYYGHNDFPYLVKVGRHGSKEVPSQEFNKVIKAAGLNDGNLEFEYIYDLSGFYTYKLKGIKDHIIFNS